MDQDPVFHVIPDPPAEDNLFYILPEPDHFLGVVIVIHPDHVLFDDGAGVKIFRDIMAGCPDELDSPFVGLVIGPSSDERREEAVVNIDDLPFKPSAKHGRKNPHVSCKDQDLAPVFLV